MWICRINITYIHLFLRKYMKVSGQLEKQSKLNSNLHKCVGLLFDRNITRRPLIERIIIAAFHSAYLTN